MSHEKRDLGGIIMIFVMLIVGISMTPTVQDLVGTATGTFNASTAPGNLTGAARAIFLLVPLFWVILIVGIALAGVVIWLKGSSN